MLDTVPRGVITSSLLGLVLLGASVPASGGLRSRALPPLAEGVEGALRERASSQREGRLWVIAEVESGARRRVERSGVRLLRSIDGDLWLASSPADVLREDRLPRGLLRVWEIQPEDRMPPGFRAASARSALGPGEEVRLRVKIFGDADRAQVRRAIEGAGAVIDFEASKLGLFDVRGSGDLLDRLAAIEAVRWIEPAPPPYQTANDGLRVDATVDEVQLLGINGSGVVIGMWDAGMPDSLHPDLAGRVSPGEPGLGTPFHSTHVAGIAIGNGTNSEAEGGTAMQWRGVATGATTVNWDVPEALAEVDTAIALHDIDLSTNSWTYQVNSGNCGLLGDYASDAPEFDAIVRGLYGKQIPVIFAAGNERDDGDCGIDGRGGYASLPPPGTAKNVITVGAHHSDALHMTGFSSWGPTDDGRMKPDLSAPGCQLSEDFGITSAFPGGTYLSLCGTSMAAPAVSGSCAMLLQEWRARFPGTPQPATYKALLGGFAEDRALDGPDYRFGLGAMKLDRSTTELQTATTIEDEVDFPVQRSYGFLVAEGTDTLVVTLAWDDPPGAELADTTLVNDLDLTLSDPFSTTYLPFVLDPANPDNPATTGTNRLDNVEQVRVVAPAPGRWSANVSGAGVTQGPQKYTLVGFDNRPPADPTAAVAFPVTQFSLALSWIRPGDADRQGTLVVRSAEPITWAPTLADTYDVGSIPSPGVTVLANDDAIYSIAAPLLDQGLVPSTVYYYALFSYDEILNYSPGVSTSAETPGPAVPVPDLTPGPAVVSFTRVGGNPVRDTARFRFDLPQEALVAVDVFDATGRRVTPLVRGPRKAGSHLVEWNGRDAGGARTSTGVYFVRFRSAELTATEKVLLVR